MTKPKRELDDVRYGTVKLLMSMSTDGVTIDLVKAIEVINIKIEYAWNAGHGYGIKDGIDMSSKNRDTTGISKDLLSPLGYKSVKVRNLLKKEK